MTIAAFAGGGSADPPPASGRPAAAAGSHGLTVFIQHGCGSCHTFKPAGSSSPIGPDLALSLHGKSRDYVLESIVLPGKVAAEGHTTGSMPEDFAERIAPDDLDELVEFLMEGAQN
jgi:mono/diheme cytochrome c family protein